MYGHVDDPRHWVSHLRVLGRVRDETGGFTEFVPLPFDSAKTVSEFTDIAAGVGRPVRQRTTTYGFVAADGHHPLSD